MRRRGVQKKVFVGLSGGVDSSVSLALLQKEGYDVTGVFIKVWQPDWIECTWKEDRLDAMRVCAKLGVPFITLDLEKEYKKEVVDYMIEEYKRGRTPNPDVMCNKEVKFGAFYEWARKQGADFVATGHYARVARETPSTKKQISNKSQISKFKLQIGKDSNKDQSYFLWNLKQEQLAHILFPIGHLEKPAVRKLAAQFGLITADKKDSQGLCFIGKIDMKDFLKNFITIKKGNVLDEDGAIIGEHDGALFYTIGERHGFSITKKTPHDRPLYVLEKDVKKNTLTVGEKMKQEKALSQDVNLSRVNWLGTVPKQGSVLFVRSRYRQILTEAKINKATSRKATLTLKVHDTLLAPGQSLVMYQDERLVGGGIIE